MLQHLRPPLRAKSLLCCMTKRWRLAADTTSTLDCPQRPVPIDQRAGSPAVQRLSAFEYRYLTEFQSHEPEFDYLKSLEIEEKINQVRDTGKPPAVLVSRRQLLADTRYALYLSAAVQVHFTSSHVRQPVNWLRTGEVVPQLQWVADAAVDQRQDHQTLEGASRRRLIGWVRASCCTSWHLEACLFFIGRSALCCAGVREKDGHVDGVQHGLRGGRRARQPGLVHLRQARPASSAPLHPVLHRTAPGLNC